LKTHNHLLHAATAAFMALAIAGCGTDEETFSDTQLSRTTKSPATVVEKTPAPPVPAPVPVVEATYENSEYAFLEGRYEDAFDLFTRYAQARATNPWGHYMLGMSAWKTGRHDAAEVAFTRAIELDSTLVKARINLARVLIEAHRPTDALAVIDGAVALEGETAVALRLRGNALQTLGRDDDAVAAYRGAIEIDPEDAWSMNNLAYILIEAERYDEALPALARATELRKDVPLFFNNLGMALEKTGHFRAAHDAYTFASSLDGVSAKAVANRDRVAGVVEQPGLSPVDLAALARAFEVDVRGATSVAATSAVEAVENTMSSPDTTESAQTPR
jgi:Flp pilus assembly protein TadD